MHAQTMNLHELARYMRNAGFPTTEIKLANGIEQGVYPFGVCIKTASYRNGKINRTFEIYTRKVEEWISDHTTDKH